MKWLHNKQKRVTDDILKKTGFVVKSYFLYTTLDCRNDWMKGSTTQSSQSGSITAEKKDILRKSSRNSISSQESSLYQDLYQDFSYQDLFQNFCLCF